MAGISIRTGIGLALAAAATLMLVARLSGAYAGLTHAAHAAAGRNELGGALAAADSIGLNDDFVRDAFASIPESARFSVVLPKDESAVEKANDVNPITFAGVSGLLANYLLPRRQVTEPTARTYIVCFYCDASAWGRRIRWLSSEVGGGRIGYLSR